VASQVALVDKVSSLAIGPPFFPEGNFIFFLIRGQPFHCTLWSFNVDPNTGLVLAMW